MMLSYDVDKFKKSYAARFVPEAELEIGAPSIHWHFPMPIAPVLEEMNAPQSALFEVARAVHSRVLETCSRHVRSILVVDMVKR